ncbi:MAG: MarR family EPS-associated transcriptional regulator [Candidatus Omnitrophica bacterium]|nr:MarR family EPS-associated transcriptional regulator [Candidatus Omnitrophota bacterium]MCG2705296.1 MarR family EPS-associated transcriptional regulator [Candidatus Omnitrophota bacterium]
MNNHSTIKEEQTLNLIREVEGNPALNQRVLSQKLNVSLGKANYLLRELAKKGTIKIASFSKNPKKAKKMRYILTRKGLRQKVKLTYQFLQVKEAEYKRLKNEYDKYVNGRS